MASSGRLLIYSPERIEQSIFVRALNNTRINLDIVEIIHIENHFGHKQSVTDKIPNEAKHQT